MSGSVSDPVIAEQVRELTTVGKSAAQIAVMLRVSERTVVRYRRRVGVAKNPTERMTAEQVAWAERLLDDGCSCAETARTVGVGPNAIQRRFPGRGWSRLEAGSYGGFVARMAGADW